MTLVQVWCTTLCECIQRSEGLMLSHSQVLDWISGSFIQSHCACSTLWAISMFSRIFAMPSMKVPSPITAREAPQPAKA